MQLNQLQRRRHPSCSIVIQELSTVLWSCVESHCVSNLSRTLETASLALSFHNNERHLIRNFNLTCRSSNRFWTEAAICFSVTCLPGPPSLTKLSASQQILHFGELWDEQVAFPKNQLLAAFAKWPNSIDHKRSGSFKHCLGRILMVDGKLVAVC